MSNLPKTVVNYFFSLSLSLFFFLPLSLQLIFSFSLSPSVLLSRPLCLVIILNLSLFRDPSIIPVGFKTGPTGDINLSPWQLKTLSPHSHTHTHTHTHTQKWSPILRCLHIKCRDQCQKSQRQPNGIIWLCSWRKKTGALHWESACSGDWQHMHKEMKIFQMSLWLIVLWIHNCWRIKEWKLLSFPTAST